MRSIWRRLLEVFGGNRLFLSYSHVDDKYVALMSQRLADHGINVWVDIHSLHEGATLDMSIADGLRRSIAVAVVLSAASRKSKWVLWEIQHAWQFQKPVFVVRTEDVELPIELDGLKNVVWCDLFGEEAAANRKLGRLCNQIKRLQNRRLLRLAVVACMIFSLFACGITQITIRTQQETTNGEVYVYSQALPLSIFVDGEAAAYLSASAPGQTLTFPEGVYKFEARRNGELWDEERIPVDPGRGARLWFVGDGRHRMPASIATTIR